MNKILLIATVVSLLISCSTRKNSHTILDCVKDTNSFDNLINQFYHNIENLWGANEVLIAGPKDYINYLDRYQTRSHIDFRKGTITIETIRVNNTVECLRQAIVKILLMSDLSKKGNFYSDEEDIIFDKEPLMYGQVLDSEGKPIRWKWRATRFANYLIRTCLQARFTGLRKISSITIQLVPNHIDKRAHKYLHIVRKASKKYGVDESLILAIIQTESSFNPYAVSRSNALGLMQVVQQSGGRDVFKMKSKWGNPSRNYLFNPKKNIDTGTAYLAMLQNLYLSGIANPISREYAVITAYNSGVSSVLRVFSQDQNQAIKAINSMSSKKVYHKLFTQHPSSEARSYLYRVSGLQRHYRN